MSYFAKVRIELLINHSVFGHDVIEIYGSNIKLTSLTALI